VRKIIIILITISITSCNPYMHIGGKVMRNHNTSLNKYNQKNSYLSHKQLTQEQNKTNKKRRENKFLFWLWRNI
jgi:hypothetical protein